MAQIEQLQVIRPSQDLLGSASIKDQAMRASTSTLVSSNCNLKCNLNYYVSRKVAKKQLSRHKKHTKQNEGHAIAVVLSGEVA